MIPFHRNPIPTPPKLLPGLKREAAQGVGVHVLDIIQEINPPVVDRRGGMPLSCLHLPQNRIILSGNLDRISSLHDIIQRLPTEIGPFSGQSGLYLLIFHKIFPDVNIICLSLQTFRPVVRTWQLHRQISSGRIDMPSNQDTYIK